jgi:Ca2+-binding RTX toxin-like protein
VPSPPVITEPIDTGVIVSPADVHMEAGGFQDDQLGATHQCSTWEISESESGRPAWRSGGPATTGPECVGGALKSHIHLGDGVYTGGHEGMDSLREARDYVLEVRFRNHSGQTGPATRVDFRTAVKPDGGADAEIPWLATQPGYAVDVVTEDLAMPLSVAMLPDPGPSPSSVIGYVAELYGSIKAIRRDGRASTYAHSLLDFEGTGLLPGTGAFGVGGIAIQPGTADVYAAVPYFNEDHQEFFARVIRLDTTGDGSSHAGIETVVDLGGVVGPPDAQSYSHQISDVSFGPDGNLYVHQGDGFQPLKSQDPDSFLGKVLRLDAETGAPVGGPDPNPLYDPDDGISARDYVYARGYRNPFGGAWREADGQHYVVENGPTVDRLSKLEFPPPPGGQNFAYDGSDASMATLALHNWKQAAPVEISFVEADRHGGSGFPAAAFGNAYVTQSGATWASGPDPSGDRITEFVPAASGELSAPPRELLRYSGTGKSTAAGLAAGPGGLYFTDLYRDQGWAAPTDPGGRLLRIRHFPPTRTCGVDGWALNVGFAEPPETGKGRAEPAVTTVARQGERILVNGEWCGATIGQTDDIFVSGGKGDQKLVLDLSGGALGPAVTPGPDGEPQGITVQGRLGSGGPDRLVLVGGDGDDTFRIRRRWADLDGDGRFDDLALAGLERVVLRGGSGGDLMAGGRLGDVIDGGPGRDRLFGGRGRDRLDGGRGRDRSHGGRGLDRCRIEPGEKGTSCEVSR